MTLYILKLFSCFQRYGILFEIYNIVKYLKLFENFYDRDKTNKSKYLDIKNIFDIDSSDIQNILQELLDIDTSLVFECNYDLDRFNLAILEITLSREQPKSVPNQFLTHPLEKIDKTPEMDQALETICDRLGELDIEGCKFNDVIWMKSIVGFEIKCWKYDNLDKKYIEGIDGLEWEYDGYPRKVTSNPSNPQ